MVILVMEVLIGLLPITAGSNGWSITNGRAICDNTNPLNGQKLK